MLVVETPRLLYFPTPLAVLRERLTSADFVAELPLANGSSPAGSIAVHFPEEWPGDDGLAVLQIWIARRRRVPDPGPWTDGVAIEKDTRLAVVSMGFKAPPDRSGAVEVGYAVNRSHRGRGYATEMLIGLSGWALARPEVSRVTAECLQTNAASIRVLEKAGFSRVGRRLSDDGMLITWEHGPDTGTSPGPG